jgi:hypothetical protein
VIETMRFRLAAGRDEAEFLQADKELQEEFAYQQPGMLRRTTARGATGDWLVVDLWASVADADACAARWETDPVARRFMAFVDRSTVVTARYEEVGG